MQTLGCAARGHKLTLSEFSNARRRRALTGTIALLPILRDVNLVWLPACVLWGLE